ncbi:glycosyl hydrolase family 95 catalytic domain-containing protein [Galbibacter sp.]|uniref:glycoside hydrolase family 95 protein n=1 Tax=Galbibacter sp. TaxID=2918471 RepID=UPI003A934D76
MKIQINTLLFAISLFQIGFAQDNLKLRYERPAEMWEESIPLGNGRLGLMPDGGISQEKLVLNEITLWSGGPQDADDPNAIKHLPEIRRLLFAGKNSEAEALMYKTFVSKGAGSGQGNGANVPYGSYQILGNLHLDYDLPEKVENYSRELDISNAVASTSFEINGVTYKREYITSFSDDVILIKLTASQPGNISFDLHLDRPERFTTTTKGKELQMRGQLNNGTDGKGMKYAVNLRVIPEGGALEATTSSLELEGANSALILISAATDYKDSEFENTVTEVLDVVAKKAYKKVKQKHIEFYKNMFDRATLDLGTNPKAEALPIIKRLAQFAQTKNDPGLAELYFQFGRYLAISSTRPGLLPPNLQGLWANTLQTPWNGDYHLDVNIQMNHWPLNVANLPMLNEPYYELIKGLVEPGEKTAKTYYNGDGWVAHVITNIWGYTSPGEHPSWGATNSGSGWLSQMLWRHYVFTQDRQYLEKVYPILKGSAQFYNSTLIEYPEKDWLVTAPSNSPENSFRLPNGKTAHVTIAPTVDNQIIRALFQNVITASEILNTDKEFRKELERDIVKLPPNQISSEGRLMEWIKEYQEPEPHHRHVSHLWGLYPGNEISLSKTPELARAAEKTLIKRGDVSTGWSLAWKINLWARLGDGERAYKLFGDLLKPVTETGFNMTDGGGTYPNLFCAHPPFQIDGNFGGTAGIAEMLIQSHEGFINFLPALPRAWGNGSYNGLRVRGGGEVEVSWEKGEVVSARLRATTKNTFKIKIPHTIKSYTISNKPKQRIAIDAKFITLDLEQGDQVRFFTVL